MPLINLNTFEELGELANKHENATIRLGNRADAIVYVFPPVARETDEELLAHFGDETRIRGSSALVESMKRRSSAREGSFCLICLRTSPC